MSIKPNKEIVAEAVAQAVREAAVATAKAVTEAASAAATMSNNAVSIDIGYIKVDIKEIKEALKEASSQSVNISEFKDHLVADADHEVRIKKLESAADEMALVKKLVFGCVTMVLVAVVTSIIYLVIRR